MRLSQRVFKFISILLYGFVCFQSMGCAATMFRGGKEKVFITSTPDGATVSIDGRVQGTTPLQTKVSRKVSKHHIILEKDGYVTVDTVMQRTLNKGWFLGAAYLDISTTLGIGLIVDWATGSLHGFPVNSIIAPMQANSWQMGKQAFDRKDWRTAISYLRKVEPTSEHSSEVPALIAAAEKEEQAAKVLAEMQGLYQSGSWDKVVELAGTMATDVSIYPQVQDLLSKSVAAKNEEEADAKRAYDNQDWDKAVFLLSKVSIRPDASEEVKTKLSVAMREQVGARILAQMQSAFQEQDWDQVVKLADTVDKALVGYSQANDLRAKAVSAKTEELKEQQRQQAEANQRRQRLAKIEKAIVGLGRCTMFASGAGWGGWTQEEAIIFKKNGTFEYSRHTTGSMGGDWQYDGNWTVETDGNGGITVKVPGACTDRSGGVGDCIARDFDFESGAFYMDGKFFSRD